jgi:hypothetical protein
VVGAVTAHYLQPLQKTALPARHVIFDTETQPRRVAGAVEHHYATGVLGHILAPGLHPSSDELPVHAAPTPQELWSFVVRSCKKGQRTVAWAHNLSFDLRVSEALRWLPRQGFRLQGIVLERTASWASWSSKEHGSLICCDLYAWLPRTLDDIAREMGVSREPWDGERYQTATLAELRARCVGDVQITRKAVQALLAWLQAEDCGPFRLTGSGQAHACWRKRFEAGWERKPKEPIEGAHPILAREEKPWRDGPPGRIWVHGDPALRQVEREAMWTGRCEAWRHGEVDGPLYEYDMNLAYCQIAATHPLPVHFRGEHGAITWQQCEQFEDEGYAVMAEVSILDIREPVVPCRVGERMIWPVGSFQTVLWSPELRLLMSSMKRTRARIERCWTYHTGPALKPMAEWIIEGLTSTATPPPIRLLLKHWARALIGRMALRYRRWEPYGTAPDLNCLLWVDRDEDGEPVENLQVGSELFELAGLEETETSVPQVTGWVMSQCRAQLWQLIQEAAGGFGGQVLYMDTDSLLVNEAAHANLERWRDMVGEPLIERKAKWDQAIIHGPRNIELDQDRRLSGVPRRSVRKGPLEWEGTVMRGVKESIVRGELDHVAELHRTYHVNTHDPRRERYPDGSTGPYRLGGEDETFS